MLIFIWIILNITLLVEAAITFPPYENIALHKPANQSSATPDFNFKASRANDGDDTNVENIAENSCIHTMYSNSPTIAWWTVNLEYISSIHEVVVTYRDWSNNGESAQGRLAGFSIFVSNTSNFLDGTRCFKQNGSLPNVFKTSYPCTATGQFITVYNERMENVTYPPGYSQYAVLELCEVEIPGCRKATFGVNCTNNCYCSGVTCDYISGECNAGCARGYTGVSCATCAAGNFGDTCSLSCPHCADDHTCDNTGKCAYGCEVGYFTDDYLPGCPNKCGNCQGEHCYEGGRCPGQCVPGFYSINCTLPCPKTCFDNQCVQTNGTCTKCSAGHFGTFCEKKCSAFCAHDTCNFETGHCEEAEKDPVHSPITYIAMGAGCGISFVLVIIAAIAIVYWRKRNEKKRRSQVYCNTDRRQHADEDHVYDHINPDVSEGHPQENKPDIGTTAIRVEVGPSNRIIYNNISDKIVNWSGDYYNQALEK